ncbi:MAG: hypothetical protein FWD74_12510, partial [Actinomycetia bacterium]|nr:hypothetical protein [Actinomycetes bacterium]
MTDQPASEARPERAASDLAGPGRCASPQDGSERAASDLTGPGRGASHQDGSERAASDLTGPGSGASHQDGLRPGAAGDPGVAPDDRARAGAATEGGIEEQVRAELGQLADLDELTPREHIERYEAVHARLRAVLEEVDQRTRPDPGAGPAGRAA